MKPAARRIFLSLAAIAVVAVPCVVRVSFVFGAQRRWHVGGVPQASRGLRWLARGPTPHSAPLLATSGDVTDGVMRRAARLARALCDGTMNRPRFVLEGSPDGDVKRASVRDQMATRR